MKHELHSISICLKSLLQYLFEQLMAHTFQTNFNISVKTFVKCFISFHFLDMTPNPKPQLQYITVTLCSTKKEEQKSELLIPVSLNDNNNKISCGLASSVMS